MQAIEIVPRLNQMIEKAKPIEPKLARRLEEFRRWIKGKPPGLIASKPYVLDFLEQLIEDAEFWLKMQEIGEKKSKTALSQISPPEYYWHTFLFSQWFNERDPQSTTWKQKIMAGAYTNADKHLLDSLERQIEQQGGSSCRRYIIDLSMKTDIIASNTSKKVLCVQLTTSANTHSGDKKLDWEFMLKYWAIERGLFIDYNPKYHPNLANSLCNHILTRCDTLPDSCYYCDSI